MRNAANRPPSNQNNNPVSFSGANSTTNSMSGSVTASGSSPVGTVQLPNSLPNNSPITSPINSPISPPINSLISSPISSSISSPIPQLSLAQLALPQLQGNPQAAASNIIQQIAQISQARQQPFSGTISLHNNQAKYTLSDIANQINSNRVGRLQYATTVQQPGTAATLAGVSGNVASTINLADTAGTSSGTASSHIAAMNLPLVTAGLAPNQQPKVVHIHHHDGDVPHSHAHSDHRDHHLDHGHDPISSAHALTEQAYQNLNVFESTIQPGSMVSFRSVLSKRKGLANEPLIKELPLNKITKFLERKKKKGNCFNSAMQEYLSDFRSLFQR